MFDVESRDFHFDIDELERILDAVVNDDENEWTENQNVCGRLKKVWDTVHRGLRWCGDNPLACSRILHALG